MKRSTKSFSFLLEFIIVLFFFALSSAICVKIQGDAQKINNQANDTKMAIQIIQNYIANDCIGALQYDKNGNANEDDYFIIEQTYENQQNYIHIKHDNEVLITLPYNGGQL